MIKQDLSHGCEAGYNLQKSINVIHHNNRLKKENQMMKNHLMWTAHLTTLNTCYDKNPQKTRNRWKFVHLGK